ncbi:hypothetical protein THAOC_24480, partial [Thalassiosira oceanica]
LAAEHRLAENAVSIRNKYFYKLNSLVEVVGTVNFKSNKECRAFIVSMREDVEESSEVDPDADAKAEQAAADLLAELGLEDLEGPSSSASKKNNQSASGKKKKRVGKKKGRK